MEIANMINCFEYKEEIAKEAFKIILSEMISNRLHKFTHGNTHEVCKAAWNVARTMNEYRDFEKLDHAKTKKKK
jgi:hypothetical protein